MKVAIHNKNGKGLLLNIYVVKGTNEIAVAIHNKNGKGLLHQIRLQSQRYQKVAIHNKNGKGLLLKGKYPACCHHLRSQSTIKMEKGYYRT